MSGTFRNTSSGPQRATTLWSFSRHVITERFSHGLTKQEQQMSFRENFRNTLLGTFEEVFVDEAHFAKSRNSASKLVIDLLSAETVFMATGTVMSNKDLYGLFHLVAQRICAGPPTASRWGRTRGTCRRSSSTRSPRPWTFSSASTTSRTLTPSTSH